MNLDKQQAVTIYKTTRSAGSFIEKWFVPEQLLPSKWSHVDGHYIEAHTEPAHVREKAYPVTSYYEVIHLPKSGLMITTRKAIVGNEWLELGDSALACGGGIDVFEVTNYTTAIERAVHWGQEWHEWVINNMPESEDRSDEQIIADWNLSHGSLAPETDTQAHD